MGSQASPPNLTVLSTSDNGPSTISTSATIDMPSSHAFPSPESTFLPNSGSGLSSPGVSAPARHLPNINFVNADIANSSSDLGAAGRKLDVHDLLGETDLSTSPTAQASDLARPLIGPGYDEIYEFYRMRFNQHLLNPWKTHEPHAERSPSPILGTQGAKSSSPRSPRSFSRASEHARRFSRRFRNSSPTAIRAAA